MTVPLQTRAFADEEYVGALRSAYAGVKLYDPSFALAQDPDVWEKMLRHPTIRTEVEKRLHAVAGRHWHVEPASDAEDDKQKAEIVEEIIRRVRGLNMARYRLASAIFHGRSYGYVEGGRVPAVLGPEGSGPMEWWIPAGIRDIDHRGVRLVPEWDRETGRVVSYVEVRSLSGQFWKRLDADDAAALIPVVYADEESRLGYGRGLIEAMYYAFYAVGRLIQEGHAGVERWAQGLVVAQVDAEAHGGTDKTSEATATRMRDTLADMKSKHILVVDKRDNVTVQWPQGTGHQMIEAFIRYWDERLTALISGSLRPSGQGDGGAYAQAKIEAESSQSLIAYDRDVLDEAVTERLLGLVCRMNMANFAALGLGDAGRPRFQTRDEVRDDPAAAAQVIATALGAGVPLRRAEVYERLGFTPPADGEDVIEGRAGGAGDPLAALLGRGGVSGGQA